MLHIYSVLTTSSDMILVGVENGTNQFWHILTYGNPGLKSDFKNKKNEELKNESMYSTSHGPEVIYFPS